MNIQPQQYIQRLTEEIQRMPPEYLPMLFSIVKSYHAGISLKEKQERLARECAKLEPEFEKSLAEEGMSGELAEWDVLKKKRSHIKVRDVRAFLEQTGVEP